MIQYPLTLPQNPLKRRFKIGLGQVASGLFADRRDALERGEVGDRLSRIDRLLIAALVDHHERAGTMDRLTPLQDWLWRGPQAVDYHTQTAARRFQSRWLQHQVGILDPIGELFRDAPAAGRRICEIGCGAGLVLDDIAVRLPGVPELVGVDLSPEQIAANRERPHDARIRYDSGDGIDWIIANAQPGTLYLTNGGVLEYFAPDRLKQLIERLPQLGTPVSFALAEPIAPDADPEMEAESRVFGSERTFSHPYLRWFKDAGWMIRYRDIQQTESRWLLMLATRL